MPYPNEHACRLESPDKFDKFNRKNCEQKHDEKCIDVIYGIKGGKSKIQALRYPKDVWSADAARSHCKEKEGTFEAAGESESEGKNINTDLSNSPADESNLTFKAPDIERVETKQDDKKYTCECIECGHTVETDEHCKDLECSECGGAMRRKERPGPGRMETPPGYEQRTFPIEEVRVIEDDGSPKIIGYAAVFNKFSEPMMGFREKIAPGAFKKALKSSDARALFNHDPNIILGRQSAGTLKLKEDEKGLLSEVNPPDTQYIRDVVLAPMKRGDIKEMSFGFLVKIEEWKEEKEKEFVTRTIVEVDRLFDISPVTFPAYPDTSVALRSLKEWRKENQASKPEPSEATLEGEEDVTPADADKLQERLNQLDVRLREIEISEL